MKTFWSSLGFFSKNVLRTCYPNVISTFYLDVRATSAIDVKLTQMGRTSNVQNGRKIDVIFRPSSDYSLLTRSRLVTDVGNLRNFDVHPTYECTLGSFSFKGIRCKNKYKKNTQNFLKLLFLFYKAYETKHKHFKIHRFTSPPKYSFF